MGWLIYFFEYACGLSGYLLEVNPFNQPGVEAYKNNMYALLGKPGYEERKAELEARTGLRPAPQNEFFVNLCKSVAIPL